MHFVSETPFGFWLMLAIIASVYACYHRRGGWGIDLLAGVCWAMAVYTRPQLLLAVPIAIGFAAIAFVLRDRRQLKHAMIQVAVLSLVLSPWVIRNAVVLHQGSVVQPAMLPPLHAAMGTTPMPVPAGGAPIRPLRLAERDIIETTIDQCGGSIARAAALLRISPSTIYRKRDSWRRKKPG